MKSVWGMFAMIAEGCYSSRWCIQCASLRVTDDRHAASGDSLLGSATAYFSS